MPRYVKSLEVPGSSKTVFDFMADFTNVADWDPGVDSSRKITDGPIGPGTSFDVVASFFGRKVPLRYEIVRFEPHTRVVFRAENDDVISLDEITCEESPHGTRLIYDADLRLKGFRRVFEPALAIAFRWIANDALQGLRKRLGAR